MAVQNYITSQTWFILYDYVHSNSGSHKLQMHHAVEISTSTPLASILNWYTKVEIGNVVALCQTYTIIFYINNFEKRKSNHCFKFFFAFLGRRLFFVQAYSYINPATSFLLQLTGEMCCFMIFFIHGTVFNCYFFLTTRFEFKCLVLFPQLVLPFISSLINFLVYKIFSIISSIAMSSASFELWAFSLCLVNKEITAPHPITDSMWLFIS